MKDWIKENINPPGMEKKNRGSLFSLIGRVFDIVRKDAIKTFNAFFPYLADKEKLLEHAQVLSVPKLPHDTDDDFRDRVTSASFYLMKAGGREYIHRQLRSRFGSQYLLKEEFLQVFVRILTMKHENTEWLQDFLDRILDPNISFRISELASNFYNGKFRYNGEIMYDGFTVNPAVFIHSKHDGAHLYDGSLKYNGLVQVQA